MTRDLNDLIGRPFVRGGRGPDGFDCWGLVLEVRRRLRLPLPPDYPSADFSRATMNALFHGERPTGWVRSELSRGAIVISQCGAHAGVFFAGRILHAQGRGGVVTWSLGHWTAVFGELECWQWPTSSS